MKRLAPALFLALGACTTGANHLGNPILWPFQAAATGVQNLAYNERRGAVEVFVMTNHPPLIADLRAGGGATLTQAFDLARVPQGVRNEHTLRLQSDLPLYAANPGALVTAIMVVAG